MGKLHSLCTPATRSNARRIFTEAFCVANAIFENYLPSNFPPESSTITLPKLASLVLVDAPPTIHGFLNILQAPNLADVDIEFGDEYLAVEVLDAVFLALKASQTGDHTPASASLQLQTERLHIRETGAATRYQNQDLGDFEWPWSKYNFWFTTSNHGPDRELHLSLTSQDGNPSVVDVLSVAKRNTNFDQLQNLRMDDTFSLQVGDWLQYFASLPQLETVTIAGIDSSPLALAFVNALAADPASTVGLVASGCLWETPYFPALQTIRFKDVEMYGHVGPSFAAVLTNTFKARHQSHPILKLHLEDVVGLGSEAECQKMQEVAPSLIVTSDRCSESWSSEEEQELSDE